MAAAVSAQPRLGFLDLPRELWARISEPLLTRDKWAPLAGEWGWFRGPLRCHPCHRPRLAATDRRWLQGAPGRD